MSVPKVSNGFLASHPMKLGAAAGLEALHPSQKQVRVHPTFVLIFGVKMMENVQDETRVTSDRVQMGSNVQGKHAHYPLFFF